MSPVSLPVNRPVGRALIVAAPGARAETMRLLGQLGYEACEVDDPYAAFVELCQNRLSYNAVILGLSSLYREELAMIAATKRRLPHLEIWLTQTDGRQAALADGVRMGADGLLADDGLHRIAAADGEDSPAADLNYDLIRKRSGDAESGSTPATALSRVPSPALATAPSRAPSGARDQLLRDTEGSTSAERDELYDAESEEQELQAHHALGEPVLTSEELRALLQEQTSNPPTHPGF